ncbi:MAG: DoxX family protein [Rhodothermales bacterium]
MNALARFTPNAHWLLRFSLAAVFLYHGLTKFPALGMLSEMMGMPSVMIGGLATMETLAGLLILVGGVGPDWATRTAGAIVSVVMVGAIFMVHLQHGWNSVNMGMGNEGRGMEFPVTVLTIALYFLIVGNNTAGSDQPTHA